MQYNSVRFDNEPNVDLHLADLCRTRNTLFQSVAIDTSNVSKSTQYAVYCCVFLILFAWDERKVMR